MTFPLSKMAKFFFYHYQTIREDGLFTPTVLGLSLFPLQKAGEASVSLTQFLELLTGQKRNYVAVW